MKMSKKSNHSFVQVSYGGVEILNTMKAHVKSFIRSVAVNAIMWGLILWSFFEFIL